MKTIKLFNTFGVDVKEQNDPNTFLKVIHGLNKVLHEYEADILNG